MEKILTTNVKNNTSTPTMQDISVLSKLGHEMKVAVHGINGVSSYTYNNWSVIDEDVKKNNLKVIMDTSNNLRNLLESLLTSGDRMQKLEFSFQNIDIVKAAKMATTYFQDLNAINEQIEIKFESEFEECFAPADQFWIVQLLTNLLSNAINYSASGSIIVRLRKEEEKCMISVEDEGVGIPENELDSIFEPFQSASNESTKEYNSTGLGLAICREIVEAHGGTIHAMNNKLSGSTVEFFLPVKVTVEQ